MNNNIKEKKNKEINNNFKIFISLGAVAVLVFAIFSIIPNGKDAVTSGDVKTVVETNDDSKYFVVTNKGAVSLAPEYIGADEYFGEKRFEENEKKEINKLSSDSNIKKEYIVFLSYLINGTYSDYFDNADEVKAAITDVETKYQMLIADIYGKFKKTNPEINKIICYKLSNDKSESLPKNLTVPDKINNTKVSSVDVYGFYKCTNIEEISFPIAVQKVGESAFEDADIRSLVFKTDMKIDFGDNAFLNCSSLQTVYRNGEDILPFIGQ